MGKTTVSVNLAYSLARRGWKTLLVDTDPQGSVGLSLSDKARDSKGFYDAVRTGGSAAAFVLPTRLAELKILTAGQPGGFFEEQHPDPEEGDEALRKVLADVAEENFDLVLFDTHAGLTGHTGSVLRVCDSVLIPQQAEPLGIRSIPQMLRAVRYLRERGAKLEIAGIVMTMVQQDHRESSEVVRELRSLIPPALLCSTVVPRDPVFLKAAAAGVPLGLLYRQPPSAAYVFDQLAAELEPRLSLTPPQAEHAYEFTKLMD